MIRLSQYIKLSEYQEIKPCDVNAEKKPSYDPLDHLTENDLQTIALTAGAGH